MGSTNSILNVASADYQDMLPQVRLTIACAEGGYSMKRGSRQDLMIGNSQFSGNSYSGGQEFLPKPNAADKSNDNDVKYAMYKLRASIIEFTKRTKETVLGAATRKDNKVDLEATDVEYLIDNVDNGGTTLETQYKQALEFCGTQGTAGLLADIPSDGNASAEAVANGVRANLKLYDFLNIIAASYSVIGVQEKLSYLLLREVVTIRVNLELTSKYQYRKLELIDGIYTHTLLDDNFEVIGDEVQPTDSSGKNLTEIPFYPIGSLNNTLKTLDAPLFLGIAELNVGQYRNSADVEENAYMSSQSTNFIFVDDKETFTTNNPDGLVLGAGAVNFLAQEDKYEMHQAKESNLSNTLQLQKVEQAIALGAQMLTEGGRAETAEAARIKASNNTATLSSVVDNTEMAYRKGITMCIQLMSTSEQEFEFDANKDFFDAKLTPEEIKVWLEMMTMGFAPREFFNTLMRKSEQFPSTATDEEIANAVTISGE